MVKVPLISEMYSKVSLSDGRMQSVSYTSDDYGDNNYIFYLFLFIIFIYFIYIIYQVATRPRWRTGTSTAPTLAPGEELGALSLL